jgi:hypothetical protein
MSMKPVPRRVSHLLGRWEIIAAVSEGRFLHVKTDLWNAAFNTVQSTPWLSLGVPACGSGGRPQVSLRAYQLWGREAGHTLNVVQPRG